MFWIPRIVINDPELVLNAAMQGVACLSLRKIVGADDCGRPSGQPAGQFPDCR